MGRLIDTFIARPTFLVALAFTFVYGSAGQVSFSAEGATELRAPHQSVIDSFHRAQALLVSARPQTAAQLLDDKQALRRLERAARDSHLDRLREGKADSIASSSLHLDVLRDLVRIQSHICALAYPLLEREAANDDDAQMA
ncbi:Na+/phosphate symporter [Paraburkholderia sp. WC7.3g]|uniref:hypothetical protein n=1 Tax=Paraburkholderia TaxID=1822464 RepID=UPI001FE280DB|nr:hypothetical protein [Paraburkholderia podalyriae]